MILPNENMYPDITWSSAFHSSFFLSVDECKFLQHDLEPLDGVDKEMSIPTLLKEKFVAVLTLGVGEDIRLYYRRLISAPHVKGKSVFNLVWDQNS